MEMKEHVGFSCATGGLSSQQAPLSLFLLRSPRAKHWASSPSWEGVYM